MFKNLYVGRFTPPPRTSLYPSLSCANELFDILFTEICKIMKKWTDSIIQILNCDSVVEYVPSNMEAAFLSTIPRTGRIFFKMSASCKNNLFN